MWLTSNSTPFSPRPVVSGVMCPPVRLPKCGVSTYEIFKLKKQTTILWSNRRKTGRKRDLYISTYVQRNSEGTKVGKTIMNAWIVEMYNRMYEHFGIYKNQQTARASIIFLHRWAGGMRSQPYCTRGAIANLQQTIFLWASHTPMKGVQQRKSDTNITTTTTAPANVLENMIQPSIWLCFKDKYDGGCKNPPLHGMDASLFLKTTVKKKNEHNQSVVGRYRNQTISTKQATKYFIKDRLSVCL